MRLPLSLAAMLLATNGALAAADQSWSDAEVRAAVEEVRRDPLLGKTYESRSLQWLEASTESPTSETDTWYGRFFKWLGEMLRLLVSGGRALLLVLAVIAAALLGVWLWRLWQLRPTAEPSDLQALPTHVRGLDIRPEHLPADAGEAALELWGSGRQRAALALLYRALLSRLVHVRRLPIRDSSTEGECRRLAQATLAAGEIPFTRSVIDMWSRAVYAGQLPSTAEFAQSCSELSSTAGARP